MILKRKRLELKLGLMDKLCNGWINPLPSRDFSLSRCKRWTLVKFVHKVEGVYAVGRDKFLLFTQSP